VRYPSYKLTLSGLLEALISQAAPWIRIPTIWSPPARASIFYSDPGHGRLMKEWVAAPAENTPWIELAKEAHLFLKGHKTTPML
jgi:hypothetical protein